MSDLQQPHPDKLVDSVTTDRAWDDEMPVKQAICTMLQLSKELAAARAEAQELRVRLRVVRAALSMHGTALEEIDAVIERQEG